MGKVDLLDIPLLLVMINFLFVSLKIHNKILKVFIHSFSRMQLEGGFQGRPNKLVDGCCSFWVNSKDVIALCIIYRGTIAHNKKGDILLSQIKKNPYVHNKFYWFYCIQIKI